MQYFHKIRLVAFVGLAFFVFVAFLKVDKSNLTQFPYQQAGLTKREAAVHLLNRFTFGPRSGEVEKVMDIGLEKWFEQQLAAKLSEPFLNKKLAPFDALQMTALEMASTYVGYPALLRMAARTGQITEEKLEQMSKKEKQAFSKQLMKEKGLQPQRKLMGTLISQKILRALYSENQLQEVLTSFWFNHFNVSVFDNLARPYVLSYERDAIRPFVLGDFREMLGATAKHPAMLYYLDNATSTVTDNMPTTMSYKVDNMANTRVSKGIQNKMQKRENAKNTKRGINENYARELMELHTMGVDGGYTQKDVQAVARAFTGWSVLPANERGNKARVRIQKNGDKFGFVLDGAFVFRADVHDAGEKMILGHHFPAGGGIEEGKKILNILATHPSTAVFLCKKLAIHFVSDNPSEKLIDELAKVYLQSGGNIKSVIHAIAYSNEFWQSSTQKIKSPFELTISALRAVDAKVFPTRALIHWIDEMGQPLYRYEFPTGFGDVSTTWISAGTLLNRMNFCMQLAAGEINGVYFNFQKLIDGPQPASVKDALQTYATILLPAADANKIAETLLPVAGNVNAKNKIQQAANNNNQQDTLQNSKALEIEIKIEQPENKRQDENLQKTTARVVGILLGSPAFQRQ